MATIDNWDPKKLGSICIAKETIKWVKKPTEYGKKIFANCTSDRVLIPQICKEFKKQSQGNYPIKKVSWITK